MTGRTMPATFISHGAPTLAIEDGDAHRFLRAYGGELGKPRAILVISAHFEAPVATVTAARQPSTIHDFRGFPETLYDRVYPAPGDPDLARRVAGLLADAGVPGRASETRGLDHGAWIPLSLLYPDADVPVVQLSLVTGRGTGYHYRLGKMLAPLRDEGVLIVGSGGATHNLGRLEWNGDGSMPAEWALSFNEWLADAIMERRIDDLLHYRERAPHAALNHPTEEHLLPLFPVLGSAHEDDRLTRAHHSFTYGSLSMDAYRVSS